VDVKMEFTTHLPLDQAVFRLERTIRVQASLPIAQQLRPHLHGQVTIEKVVLYRERGMSNWYGRLKGRFTVDGGVTRLTGRFERSLGIFMTLWSVFLIVWSLVLAGILVIRWQRAESIAWLVAAVIAASAGIAAFWFRAKNARAEAQLLSQDIADVLRGPDA
jgi:hypothetical protein